MLSLRGLMRRARNRGFVLLLTMTVLAGVLAMNAATLGRSIVELSASNRHVAKLQAFHAAEGGLDDAIVVFRAGGAPFLQGGAWYDQGGGPGQPCIADAPCLGTFLLDDGHTSVLVTIDDISSEAPTVTAQGAAADVNQTIEVVLAGGNVMDYAWFTAGPAQFRNGQAITFDGGPGRVHVEGDMTLEGGNYSPDPAKKTVIFRAGEINIYGSLVRTTNNPVGEAPVYIQQWNAATNQWEGNKLPTPSVAGAWKSTDDPTAYLDWRSGLDSSPATDPMDAGVDLGQILREANTGAVSLAGMSFIETSIDAFVGEFAAPAAADITITDPANLASLPCSSAFTQASFANPSIVQVVTVVEIDANVLTGCRSTGTVVYSTAPVRLVNGTSLTADLTVVSPKAIYVKGDFNVSSPKRAAIVSGNRTYHLSTAFTDYPSFIDRGSYPTLAQAIRDSYGDGDTQALYEAFASDPRYCAANCPPGNTAPPVFKVIPPFAAWLSDYAEPTEQRVAIISPLASDTDHALMGGDHTIEDWGDTSGPWSPKPPLADYTGPDGEEWIVGDKILLKQIGAFINLCDTTTAPCSSSGPNQLADGLPQDKRHSGLSGAGKKSWWFVTHAPRRKFVYDPNLLGQAPPGLSRSVGIRQRMWRQP